MASLVAVIWDDAHSDDWAQELTHDEGEAQAAPVVTYGFITKETDDIIRVSCEMTDSGTYRGHTVIPRSLLREIKVLRKSPVKVKKTVTGRLQRPQEAKTPPPEG